MDSVEIKATHIAGKVHMLEGRGGNIGVFAGPEGVLLVDDQFAPLTVRIVAAIRHISKEPILYVVNTHLHPDHTGGNENLGKMGIRIVAHDKVRERLADGFINRATGQKGPPAPEAALPTLTYTERLSFHLNGEEVQIIKVPAAHTDGDSIVFFTGSNVIHAGDVFRTTTYPVIDTNHGGTFHGTLQALSIIIQLANPDTIIIPGHGEPSSLKDVLEWRKMLVTIANRIQQSVDKGDHVDEALARNPGLEFNHRWAAESGWASEKEFMTTIYNELQSR